MDNATIHRSRETRLFLERHKDELSPFHLPKYSPQPNKVEGRINRRLKRDICTNHTYGSIQELEAITRRYVRNIINDKNFWT